MKATTSDNEYFGSFRVKPQRHTVSIPPRDDGKYRKTRIESHTSVTTSCEFDPTGRILLSSNDRGQINLCNVVDAFDSLIYLRYHWKPITEVHFSTNGTIFYSSSEDQSVVVWDAERWLPLEDLIGHKRAVNTVQFSRTDESLLCTGSSDRTIRMWDVRTGECCFILHWDQDVSSTCFSGCGGYIFGAGLETGEIIILDVRMNMVLETLDDHTGPVTGLSLSPCGKFLASCAGDDTLRMWDVSSWAKGPILIHKLSVEQDTPNCLIRCAWSLDGSMLTCGTTGSQVLVFDGEKGKVVHRLDGHKGTVTAVNFNPRCPVLMSAGTDGFLILHDI